MRKRIITAIIMAIVMIPLLYLGSYFSYILTVFLSYIAGLELMNLFIIDNVGLKKYKYIYPLFSVGLVTQFFLVSQKLFEARFLYFFLGVEILISFLICLFDKNLKMHTLGSLLTILIYSGFMFGCMMYLRFVNTIGSLTHEYLGLMVFSYVLICAFGTDIFALFGGLLCGKHKLWPSVSPKKTIEGSIIGSFIATILATIYVIVVLNLLSFSIEFIHIIIIIIVSLVLSIISQLGDLTASKFKRDYNIKDFGNIFPGHGGVLDRFDSLIMTSTALFMLLIFFGVI